MGATAILPGDTLVLVPGYVEGMDGEVSFELYYDSLKRAMPPITEYYVKDPEKPWKQKRTIHSTEKQDYFMVSFKGSSDETYFVANPQISVMPNPARERCSVSFTLPQAGKTVIEIYDLFGRKIDMLSDGILPAGKHYIDLKLNNEAGTKFAEGVYLIQLKCGQYKVQAKLIILQ